MNIQTDAESKERDREKLSHREESTVSPSTAQTELPFAAPLGFGLIPLGLERPPDLL